MKTTKKLVVGGTVIDTIDADDVSVMTSAKLLLNDLESTPNPSSEPAFKVGSLVATVAGLAAVATYFFPNIPDSVIQTLLVIVAFLTPILSAALTRGQVWSPASVQEVVNQAVKEALDEAANRNRP